MHSKAYYSWHTKKISPAVHFAILLAYLVAIPLVGRDVVRTPSLYAEEPVTTTSADGTTTTRQAVYEDAGDGVDLTKETLTDAFPNLSSVLPALAVNLESGSNAIEKTNVVKQVITVSDHQTGETSYTLDSGVEVLTKYEPGKNKQMGAGGENVKQTITLKNPTGSSITTDLDIDHTIAATTFSWDGKEYTASDQEQTFTPYEADVTLDPKSPADAKQFEGIPEDQRKTLPKIQHKTTKGLAFSFKAKDKDGKEATFTYDASDLKDAKPTFTLKQDNGKTKLTVHLNKVTVNAKSEKVLDPSYSMSTSTNWNVRIDGGATSDYLTYSEMGDINGDGIDDLVTAAPYADNNSRSASGSVYVVLSGVVSGLSGAGNTLSLGTSSSYYLRLDGASASDYLGFSRPIIADLNNNGQNDLLISAYGTDYNSKAWSGSLYIVYDTILRGYSGTGNNLDMNTSTNWSVRIDGSAANTYFPDASVVAADLTRDGRPDILAGTGNYDFNSRANSGSIYVIDNATFGSQTGTGNAINLATSSNYKYRFDGPVANAILGYCGGYEDCMLVEDIDNDSNNDLVIAAQGADYNSRSDSGSIYSITSDIFIGLTGSGNNIDLATTTNWKSRIDGPTADTYFAYSYGAPISLANVTGDTKPELFIAHPFETVSGLSYSGAAYMISNSLLAPSGTGNTYDLATSTNYLIKFAGSTDESLAYFGVTPSDYNNDSLMDLAIGSPNSIYDGTAYIIDNSILNSVTGSGQSLSMSSSSNYTNRFTGGNVTSASFGQTGPIQGDLNNDDTLDLVFDSNGTSNKGALYLIFGFPHSVSTTALSSSVSSASQSVTGTVTATSSSVTTVSDVQYKLDSNTASSGWTSCSASDGSFNSTTESYSCSVDLGSTGSHTVYVRAKDNNGVYTAQSRYGSATTNYAIASTSSSSTSTSSSASPSPEATATPSAASADTTAPELALTKLGGAKFRPNAKRFTYYGQRPEFVGTGESSATVTISSGDKTLCSTTVADSKWTCKVTSTLEYGEYTVTVSASDAAGNKTTLPTFTLVTTAPVTPSPEATVSTSSTPTVSPSAGTSEQKKATYEATASKNESGQTLISLFKVKVLDVFGRPKPGVTVTLHSDPKTAVSDQDGIATFTDVPTGDHTVAYTLPGNIKVSRTVQISDPFATNTTLTGTVTVTAEPVAVGIPASLFAVWSTSGMTILMVGVLVLIVLRYPSSSVSKYLKSHIRFLPRKPL